MALLKGLLSAVAATIVGMVILALLVVYARLSDAALSALNQLLKLTAIFIGTWKAVGRGGTNGFASGVVVGAVYIALGYGLCAVWDGMSEADIMLSVELALGALIGGVSGALAANLPGGKGHPRKRAA
jgi:putative membrane protein (TIGR04086 family)